MQTDRSALINGESAQIKSKYLDMVFKYEAPSELQRKLILKDISRAVGALKDKKFNDITELAYAINLTINPDLEGIKDTLLIKYAYPEKAGLSATGTLDCDARSILTKVVMEQMGFPLGEPQIVSFVDHTTLYFEGRVIDLNINKEHPMTESEFVKRFFYNTDEKFESQMLTNAASALLNKHIQPFSGASKDIEKHAAKMFATALELSAENILALKNIDLVIKGKDKERLEAKLKIFNIMLNNFYNTEGAEFSKAEVIKGIKENRELFKAYWDALEFSHSFPKKKIHIAKNFMDAGNLTKDENMFVHRYIAEGLFELKKYESSISAHKAFLSLNPPDKHYYEETLLIARVLNGEELTADELNASVILNALSKGESISFNYFLPCEAFKEWRGSVDFLVEKMGADRESALKALGK